MGPQPNLHPSGDGTPASGTISDVAPSHVEQLVYVESEDAYLLEGAVISPASGGRDKLPVVWVHPPPPGAAARRPDPPDR
ncbi:MAG TPA: hypothetical protein VFC93_03385 [Chloroflexota bacterium]|nr:hypothetical protein [Chloroflexota bacterium]